MPIKSKAQLDKLAALVKGGKMSKSTFDRWVSETPNIHKLPERAGKARVEKVKKAKRIR